MDGIGLRSQDEIQDKGGAEAEDVVFDQRGNLHRSLCEIRSDDSKVRVIGEHSATSGDDTPNDVRRRQGTATRLGPQLSHNRNPQAGEGGKGGVPDGKGSAAHAAQPEIVDVDVDGGEGDRLQGF